MSDLHVHFHGNVAAGATLVIQVPPTGGIAAALNQLKEQMTMNDQEALDAINAANAKIDALSTQTEKSFNEIVIAISNAGNVSPEVAAALTAQAEKLNALGMKVQTLDDLNTDAAPSA